MFFRGLASRIVVRLTAHLHPVPRLRMCGAIPPLKLYACTVCTRTTFLYLWHSRLSDQHTLWLNPLRVVSSVS